LHGGEGDEEQQEELMLVVGVTATELRVGQLLGQIDRRHHRYHRYRRGGC